MKNALELPAPIAPSSSYTKSSGKAKKHEHGDNRGELEEITIRPASNGFTVCCRFEPAVLDPKIDRYNQTPEPEEMVFNTVEDALMYAGKRMRGDKSGAEKSKKPAEKKS